MMSPRVQEHRIIARAGGAGMLPAPRGAVPLPPLSIVTL
jgi:hypothetical protein